MKNNSNSHNKLDKNLKEYKIIGLNNNGVPQSINKRALLFMIFLLILILPLTNAAPSINSVSGTLQHKQSITISGSNFGTKVTAAPLKWDNFETGTHNTDLTGWTLRSTFAAARPKYWNAVTRPNSSLSAMCDFTYRPSL